MKAKIIGTEGNLSVVDANGRVLLGGLTRPFAQNLVERLDYGNVENTPTGLVCACCEGPLSYNGTCEDMCCGWEDWPDAYQDGPLDADYSNDPDYMPRR